MNIKTSCECSCHITTVASAPPLLEALEMALAAMRQAKAHVCYLCDGPRLSRIKDHLDEDGAK